MKFQSKGKPFIFSSQQRQRSYVITVLIVFPLNTHRDQYDKPFFDSLVLGCVPNGTLLGQLKTLDL